MRWRPTQAEEITALEASVDNLSRLLDAARDRIAELEADAEVGRLLREVRERFGARMLCWAVTDLDEGTVSADVTLSVCDEDGEPYDTVTMRGSGDTDAAALRALLGEEGGQHDAG